MQNEHWDSREFPFVDHIAHLPTHRPKCHASNFYFRFYEPSGAISVFPAKI
jgi:hypothetical protein